MGSFVSGSADEASLSLQTRFNFGRKTPELPRDTWQDLIAMGRVGLIESEELRRRVARFYLRVDLQSAFHTEWVGYVSTYRRGVGSVISPDLHVAVAQFRIAGAPIPLELIPTKRALEEAITPEPGVASGAGEVLTTNWAGAGAFRRLSADAKGLLTELRAELSRR